MGTHPEVCVGGVVVCADELLLIRRGRGAGVGLWSIPGGRVEFGESLVEAVAREVAEETGLVVDGWRYLGHVERIADPWHFVIHDFLAEIEQGRRPEPCAGDDALEATWVRRGEVAGLPGLAPGLAEFLIEHEVIAPAD